MDVELPQIECTEHLWKDYLMKGTIKMFNKEKGFGFISAENGTDVFFHYSSLDMDGFKTVSQGEEVEFELEQSDRGLRASKIVIL